LHVRDLAAVLLTAILLAAICRQNLAALVSAHFVHHVGMVRSLVLHVKPSDAVLPAAECRPDLAPLVLASLILDIRMILILVTRARISL
jgi:hypothetical protein